jgi:hypothetical protein
MKRILSLLVCVVFAATGCATIVGKDLFSVPFQSSPDGASVSVKDEKGMLLYTGTTPTMFTLKAGESYFHAKSYIVTFSKAGYTDQTITVRATMSGWFFGNIVFGGLIGMLIVDPISGKMWKLPDTPVFGNLSAKAGETSMNETGRSLKVVNIDQIPMNLRSHLVALN